MSQPPNVCFYSNKCKWSEAFLTELSSTPWKKEFRFICADQPQNRPKWLKAVPTLVLGGSNEPIEGQEVMNWLQEKKMMAQNSGGGPQFRGTGQAAGNSGPQEPDAWNMMEQASFSKGFSQSGLDTDTSAQGDGGFTMPGAFSFLNGAAAPGDRTGQSFPGGTEPGRKKSKKEELFDRQMEAQQRDRDAGMPQRRAPM